MVGGFIFKLVAKRVEYKFTIKRKITKITGKSATGKSELIRLLTDAQTTNSGILVECKYKCRSINSIYTESVKQHIASICQKIRNHNSSVFAAAMREYLGEYDNMLIFADEDFKGMNTDEFALFCKFTDSFFVLLCRDPLHKLPYSYEEIYTIRTSGKFHELVPVFNKGDFLKFYEDRLILVEDSNAGFEFYSYFYNNVKSAEGKSKINGLLNSSSLEIVADGAAFGCELERVLWTIRRNGLDTKLFLPESFEYLLLSSELFGKNTETNRISDPIPIISGLYFSWEQYFTQILTRLSEKFANNYSKSSLNECYCKPCCCKNGKTCNMNRTTKKKEAVLGRYLQYETDKFPKRNTHKLNIF